MNCCSSDDFVTYPPFPSHRFPNPGTNSSIISKRIIKPLPPPLTRRRQGIPSPIDIFSGVHYRSIYLAATVCMYVCMTRDREIQPLGRARCEEDLLPPPPLSRRGRKVGIYEKNGGAQEGGSEFCKGVDLFIHLVGIYIYIYIAALQVSQLRNFLS
ncbi:hypothetical protein HOY80DRAFT_744601 [Tuber brumale]|nr:hypothetical protein HOY80DRAFT_744601 [Tuber brumale]